MFLAMRAAAIIKPSLPKAAVNSLLEQPQPIKQATTVDSTAHRKDGNNGPHLVTQSRRSAPNKTRGVASCNVKS